MRLDTRLVERMKQMPIGQAYAFPKRYTERHELDVRKVLANSGSVANWTLTIDARGRWYATKIH